LFLCIRELRPAATAAATTTPTSELQPPELLVRTPHEVEDDHPGAEDRHDHRCNKRAYTAFIFSSIALNCGHDNALANATGVWCRIEAVRGVSRSRGGREP
jgi:hypothetical protein